MKLTHINTLNPALCLEVSRKGQALAITPNDIRFQQMVDSKTPPVDGHIAHKPAQLDEIICTRGDTQQQVAPCVQQSKPVFNNDPFNGEAKQIQQVQQASLFVEDDTPVAVFMPHDTQNKKQSDVIHFEGDDSLNQNEYLAVIAIEGEKNMPVASFNVQQKKHSDFTSLISDSKVTNDGSAFLSTNADTKNVAPVTEQVSQHLTFPALNETHLRFISASDVPVNQAVDQANRAPLSTSTMTASLNLSRDFTFDELMMPIFIKGKTEHVHNTEQKAVSMPFIIKDASEHLPNSEQKEHVTCELLSASFTQIKVEQQALPSVEQLYRTQAKSIEQLQITENFKVYFANIDEALLRQTPSLSMSFESPFLQGGKLHIDIEQGRLHLHFDISSPHLAQQLAHAIPDLKQLLGEKYPQLNTQLSMSDPQQQDERKKRQNDEHEEA